MLWSMWFACWTAEVPQPHVQAASHALDAWNVGEQALLDGEVGVGREALERALAERPDDPLLGAWLAHAEARAGQLDTAIARLDRVLKLKPAFAVARYNRGAYRARAGDLDGAAEDLQAALSGGASTPRKALRDPDFAAVRRDPRFAFLPEHALDVSMFVPAGLAFLGSRVEVRLEAVGLNAGGLDTLVLPLQGPVKLLRVEQDDVARPDGDRARSWVWTLQVTGAGEVRVGPVELTQGVLDGSGPGAAFPTSAPGGHVMTVRPARSLWSPEMRLANHPTPTAWQEEGLIWTAVGGAERVELKPLLPPDVLATMSVDGRIVRTLNGYADGLEQVRLGGGGQQLWPREDEP
jgi:hypothetical protein